MTAYNEDDVADDAALNADPNTEWADLDTDLEPPGTPGFESDYDAGPADEGIESEPALPADDGVDVDEPEGRANVYETTEEDDDDV